MIRVVSRGIVTALAAAGAVALTAAQSPQAPAQQPPSATKMVLKGKAPVSKEILRVTLPKPQEVDLANGLHLMVLEDRRIPQVTFQIIIPGAGGYFDPADQIGLASYTASVMREGTKSKTSPQISEALETMAASLFVSAGFAGPTASVSGSALTENLDRLMDLTADVLLNPAFPDEEWNRLRTRTRALLQQQRTQPGFLASEMFNRVVFGTHPASRVTTTPAMLEAITTQAMAEFHRTHFVPDHAAMAFAGDISLADARTLVDSRFAAWKKAGVPKPAIADPQPAGKPRVCLVDRPNSVQTTFFVGTQSMKRTDADYVALTVANRVLGGAMGRLFRHLREEKGYTYGVGSNFSATSHVGSWQASMSVRTEVTEPALNDLLAEIAEMRDKEVPRQEFEDVKRALVASFALSLESPAQMLNYHVDRWLYGLSPDYWDTYASRLEAVTVDQAQAAARQYLDAGRLHIVAVGDASKIAGILKGKGELELYDAEGKSLTR